MSNKLQTIRINSLYESPENSRHVFDERKLKELAQSIKAQGFKVRLIVRQGEEGRFEIVAGARRYRAALAGGNNGSRPGRQRPGFAPNYPQAEPEPSRRARMRPSKEKFRKRHLSERIKQNGEEKPSLIIFDLNSSSVKPLHLIPKLKNKLKKTSVIGFLSHLQGDLKQKAHEVGLRHGAASLGIFPEFATTPASPRGCRWRGKLQLNLNWENANARPAVS